MKEKFNLALFLGCCAIGACIWFAGVYIGDRIPATPHNPDHLYVSMEGEGAFADFLDFDEAFIYVKFNRFDAFQSLIDSGELDGTYTKFSDKIIFSKEKLSQWMEERIKNQ